MRQFHRLSKILGMIGLAVILLFSYNNCGNQQFMFSKVESFNPFDIDDEECTAMIELTHPADGAPLVIPKRNGSGICYSIKLANGVENQSSLNFTDLDTSVLANDHGAGNRSINKNLRKLGEKITRLIIEGPRAIKLSGSSDGLSPILVDNIILVGILPTSELNNPAYYKAYGTEDCKIWPESDIGKTFPFNQGSFIAYGPNHYPIPVTAYALGGTASVVPWRIDGPIEIGSDYSIDYRGLDCGGSAESTDIYLTFE